ncbi:cartilage matrix protein-like isoform X2 [Gigantopelta aegis]|uniref:cartilage matrix protein-like isoform X2 n=1 Tax=Gigantopelta aegis TaxID=1735272 RepID=UPI001B889E42|nr:cartilage matrix protein-like isoform X2 [Gigantopelta aegis]
MRLLIILHLGLSVVSIIRTEEDDVCGGKPADVVFLLDSSSSIEFSDFHKQIRFTQEVVGLFDIGSDRTRVGVVLFSDSVHPTIDLSRYTDKTSLLSAIRRLQYIGGGTHTGEALTFVVDKVYNINEREGVPKIAIVLTDGQSYDKPTTIKEANRAHAAGISIFVIGIGLNTDESELRAIASDPDGEFLLQIESYSTLERFKRSLAIKACEVEYVEPQQLLMDSSGPGACSLKVIFGADTSGMTTGNSLQISTFFSDVTEAVTSSVGHLQSSQITSDCPASGGTGSKSYASFAKEDAPPGVEWAIGRGACWGARRRFAHRRYVGDGTRSDEVEIPEFQTARCRTK